jgi:peptidyl-prolyl cis-trans isomerase SurA
MKMKYTNIALLLGIALLSATAARAQENDVKPVDEVIVRVNAGVIMRSAFESQQRDLLEELKKRGLTPEELEKQFNEWKPRILDELIGGQLLAQRAKDLSINVDAQVSQLILRQMKEVNCDSDKCLEQKMREAGLDIDEFKRIIGENFSTKAVLGQEVYGKVYRALTEKEKREFYEKNKQQLYAEPAEITLSNIFIAFGKDQNQALERAKEIVVQARTGAVDFKTLAQKYTESEAGQKESSLGTFKIPELKPEVKAAVENSKAGEVTDPIKLETGYSIFHVDQRKEQNQLTFEDERVQSHIGNALVEQYAGQEVEAYLTKLRNDAFIEIDARYQFENSKVKSVQIKRVLPGEETGKKKKEKKEKEEKEKKAAEAPKASADNKP